MVELFTPLETLSRELEMLKDSLSGSTAKDPEGILDEMSFAAGWLTRLAEMTADAEYHLNRKRGEVARANAELPATVLREILAAECAEEQRVWRLAERISAGLVHRIDVLRSQISYEKEQARIAGAGSGP